MTTASFPQQHKSDDRPMVSQIAKRANEIWRRMGKPKGKYSRSWNQAKAELSRLSS